MSEVMMFKCSCGRDYNAAKLHQCPVCGTPSRGGTPVAPVNPTSETAIARAATYQPTTRSASIEQRMLAELEKQTLALQTIRLVLLWSFWLTICSAIIVALAFMFI